MASVITSLGPKRFPMIWRSLAAAGIVYAGLKLLPKTKIFRGYPGNCMRVYKMFEGCGGAEEDVVGHCKSLREMLVTYCGGVPDGTTVQVNIKALRRAENRENKNGVVRNSEEADWSCVGAWRTYVECLRKNGDCSRLWANMKKTCNEGMAGTLTAVAPP